MRPAIRAVCVDIAKWVLPGAGILSGTLGGIRQDGGARAAGETDDLFFGVNLRGSGIAVQRGREITASDGDAILLNPATGPFALVRPRPARFLGLRVPRTAIAPLVVGLDDRELRPIPSTTESLKLLISYLLAVLDSRLLASPDTSRVVVTHLHDLIALSVGATRDAAAAATDGGGQAARLLAIKSDIIANLEDSALAVTAIAARHRVTPRYVHRLFESEGVTYTQFVLRQRLARAYRMLRDSRFAARRISAIAYDVGFGDLSYFNRAFRRQYHATPSDIRNLGNSSSAAEANE